MDTSQASRTSHALRTEPSKSHSQVHVFPDPPTLTFDESDYTDMETVGVDSTEMSKNTSSEDLINIAAGIAGTELHETHPNDGLSEFDSEMSEDSRGENARMVRACAVCGDSAFGRNFGVASCESCKAFFRRNMHKDSLFGRCAGVCQVTIASRTHCKRCRLKKCFAVGMKREMTRKMYGVRHLSQSESVPSSSTGQQEDVLPLPERGPPPEICHEDFYRDCLAEVQDAFKNFHKSDYIPEQNACLMDVDFVNLIEYPTRRIVKVSKNLTTFRNLDTDDQVALLKGGIMELTWLVSAMNFNPDGQSWVVGKDQHRTTLKAMPPLEGRPELGELFQMNANFSTTVLKMIQGDFNVLKLMLIVCLFSPDRSGLKQMRVVEAIQERFAIALYHYTCGRHPEKPGLFSKTIQKLTDVRDVSEKHTQMLMNLNVGKLRPLIVEVFDLPKDK